MTIYDKLLLTFYFLAIVYIQCRWQAALFKANKPISHFWHSVIYAVSIGPAIWFFWPAWWQVIVIGVVTRLAFFDFILNLCRGKPLLYNAGKDAGSVIDRLENRFSITWIRILKVVYVVVFIIVLIKIK